MACHEQHAGDFASFEECQDAANRMQLVQFKQPIFDEQGAVLTAISCRLIR